MTVYTVTELSSGHLLAIVSTEERALACCQQLPPILPLLAIDTYQVDGVPPHRRRVGFVQAGSGQFVPGPTGRGVSRG